MSVWPENVRLGGHAVAAGIPVELGLSPPVKVWVDPEDGRAVATVDPDLLNVFADMSAWSDGHLCICGEDGDQGAPLPDCPCCS